MNSAGSPYTAPAMLAGLPNGGCLQMGAGTNRPECLHAVFEAVCGPTGPHRRRLGSGPADLLPDPCPPIASQQPAALPILENSSSARAVAADRRSNALSGMERCRRELGGDSMVERTRTPRGCAPSHRTAAGLDNSGVRVAA